MNLIETGYHEINADGDPDLGAHGVLAGAEEGFDPEVLLDPFEEEFDLPATLVDCRDGHCREFKVIGQEYQSLAGIGVEVTDTSEFFRVVDLSLPRTQADDLIAAQPGCFVDWPGFQDVELGITFRADDKAGLCRFDAKQSGEVEVSPVEDIDASFFEAHRIHKVDVVNRTVGDTHEYWDWTVQVDLSVEFDRGFSAPKMRPWEHRQTQVDRRGIDGVNHLVQVEPVGVSRIQLASFADEDLSKCFVNAPIAVFVGVSKVRPGDVAPNTHAVEMVATTKAGFDVAQTLSEGDLRKGHRQELIASGHTSACPQHRKAINAPSELLRIQHIGDLGENESSCVHLLLRTNQSGLCHTIQMQDTTFSSLAA